MSKSIPACQDFKKCFLRTRLSFLLPDLLQPIYSLPPRASKIVALPLYAGLTMEEQMSVFSSVPSGERKVVVSTNIAEASVTIDGIKFVIDSGYVKVCCFLCFPFSVISTLSRFAHTIRHWVLRRCLPSLSPPLLRCSELAGLVAHLPVSAIAFILHNNINLYLRRPRQKSLAWICPFQFYNSRHLGSMM